MKTVKDLLFTPTGVMVTALHVCFFVGVITCVIGFRLYVLDLDPTKTTKPETKQSSQK